MVVINFSSEELFDRIHDPPATGKSTIDPIPGMIPQREAYFVSLSVIQRGRSGIQRMIGPGRTPEDLDFLFRKERPDDEKSIVPITGDFLLRENTAHLGMMMDPGFFVNGTFLKTERGAWVSKPAGEEGPDCPRRSIVDLTTFTPSRPPLLGTA